jgi:hypothetical protein
MRGRPAAPGIHDLRVVAAFIRWKPSAYDEKRVAGRF